MICRCFDISGRSVSFPGVEKLGVRWPPLLLTAAKLNRFKHGLTCERENMMEKLVPNNDSETMMAIVMLGDVDLPGNNALSSAIRVRLPDVSLPGEDA